MCAVENERVIRDELHGVLRNAPRALCVLDWDLKVVESNRAACEYASRWNGADPLHKPGPFTLPSRLIEPCQRLKKAWPGASRARRDGVLGRITVSHPDGQALQARITMQLHNDRSLAKPGFVVEFEEDETDVMCPDPVGLAYFSPRERRLVRLVCKGKSNQEIAEETQRALGTVKNALHGIFKKLGVPSRSALIARVGKRPLH